MPRRPQLYKTDCLIPGIVTVGEPTQVFMGEAVAENQPRACANGCIRILHFDLIA